MLSEERNMFQGLMASESDYPSDCVHELVSGTARAKPAEIAITFGDQQVTYGELERHSTQLAHVLRARGVTAGSLVGLLVDRHPRMIVAILAILKSGAGYVPLDPSYPSARLTNMLSASKANLLVSETAVLSRLALDIQAEIVLLDEHPMSDERIDLEASGVTAEDTCYVMYTSGSTGQPKGVPISHGSLVNIFWAVKNTAPGIDASDTMLAITSVSFDLSTIDLLLPLVVGGRIELATFQEISDPELLLRKLDTCKITILLGTPVTWRALILAGWTGRKPLKVMCCGEEMTPSMARDLLARSACVWNLYGPTETTVFSTGVQITSAFPPIPLGLALANTSLYVLDEERNPVTIGDAGELYIGGKGLAKGYLHRPDLTEERFVFVDTPDLGVVRLYKTGDRVRPMADGSLEFLGRVDRQIKLRGFRIELGEIEQVARTCAGVQESAVLKIQDGERGDFLAAYVVPLPGTLLQGADVRRHLAELLPRYMVPLTITVMEKFPASPNGKVDRKQLPAPVLESQTRHVIQEDQPKGEVEIRLTKIWRTTLKVPNIGRHDNFFEVGGDSLLAAQLVNRISRSFAKRCGVASLMQSPTIASYATFLTEGRASTCIVLNEGSHSMQSRKLFWIDHPDRLHRLAGMMAEQPFYSILISSEDIAKEAPAYKMERLAACMVKQILEHQREGCFYIGGFCQNATLAYEVAQQLSALGHRVPLLTMIDPPELRSDNPSRSALDTVRRRLELEGFHLSTMLRQQPSQWVPYLQRRIAGIRFILDGRRWQRRALKKGNTASTIPSLAQALFVSELSYVPKPYDGRVLFIQPTVRPLGEQRDAVKGWITLAVDSKETSISGDHLTVFGIAGVGRLAEELKRNLSDDASDVLPAVNRHVPATKMEQSIVLSA